MRWSSAIRVGLSGTSLALAMMGCSKADDAAKREADPAAEQADDNDAYDSEKRDAERAEKRETERAAEQARVRREEQSRLAERNASGEPTPWFLRPAGDTKQASVQQNDGQQQAIASDPPEQPKPIVKKPIQQPVQPIAKPNGWRHMAACGRG